MYDLRSVCRLGVYEKAMPADLEWEQKLMIARSLGFDFIEISIDESEERLARLTWSDNKIYHLRRRCEQLAMPFQSMCLSAHRRYPFGSKYASTRARAATIMQQAISLAYKLGVRCIQLAGYDVYYEEQSETTHQFFISGMRHASKLAERAGIMLGVEIMDTPYLNSLSKFEMLKRAIPSPWFMAYPDVGNISGWNYDISTELMLSGNHIVQIHLKESLNVTTQNKGQFRNLLIGEGNVDFLAVFRTLARMNYNGPLVIEMWAEDKHWKTNLETAKSRLLAWSRQAGFALTE